MRDILDGLTAWRARGEPFALATVVQTWSSAPRPPGTAMAVSAAGEVLGSISGGCVEGDTYELARHVIKSGEAALARFGVTDDDAFASGLTCGGIIDVFVEPVGELQYPTFDKVLDAIRGHRPVVVATVTSGTAVGQHVTLDESGVVASAAGLKPDDSLVSRMGAMLTQSDTDVIHGGQTTGSLPSASMFLQSYAPPPRMIVFGAIDFAAAVADIGKFLGYHVTVCDARPVFATAARFPDVDRLVVDWPHRYLRTQRVEESTVLCVLTHDPKFDIPLLEVALETPARYIGVMGSRRSHRSRLESLRGAGIPEGQLDRLSSPIGLDLGARTSEETAVSIAAEIIAAARGATGLPLREREGAIHR
ncbi:XdhC/CoxI family protein [Nocardioides immobilis]|uniref:XdhC/CoxI family protein n=1 Tax=Nocardioides immobilis TaxID=2049295 RepID=A0A417Y108_9ACTN|nr:XdhC/CoxI family protein [Nocardioides immobilis]RHW26340.1 XdhC/CoxI family protein [Nocardioides immobilis]